jgi:hypothetical protein
MSAEATYLHPDDYPWANVILALVASNGLGVQRDVPGYTPEPEGGATVDWDRMLGSWLSSTEKAAVHVARGLAIAERSGGFSAPIGSVILAAAQSIVTGDSDVEAAVGSNAGADG